MNALMLLEQALNGLQFGLMLFLLAAGLTLVFGIMDMINLAHGSLYMVGAYLVATIAAAIRVVLAGAWRWALLGTAAVGVAAGNHVCCAGFYRRDHLSQVLGTFAHAAHGQ
jgi:branched-chain amino acid transport system permease protein